MSSRITRTFHIIRYRFLLFAGVFPFILGQAMAFRENRNAFSFFYFSIGFAGVVLVLTGVECFNEYFDSKLGTDRVFEISNRGLPHYTFRLGVLAFASAFLIAIYLAIIKNPQILLFAFLGFLIAGFYVTPPIKWAYRGLGEFVIFLAYGPLMTLGSYYIQTGKINFNQIIGSLLPGLLIFSVSLINEIPDYFQDRLVGKRNIVVRIGKKKAILLYEIILILFFIFLGIGIILKILPPLSILIFLTLPLAYCGIKVAKKYYDSPVKFIPAIRLTVLLYTFAISLFVTAFLY